MYEYTADGRASTTAGRHEKAGPGEGGSGTGRVDGLYNGCEQGHYIAIFPELQHGRGQNRPRRRPAEPFSPLCGYFPRRSRWKPTEGTAGRKAGQIGKWYMYQFPFSNRCRTASAQYLFRDTPAAAAASRSSSFFPFGTRTMIESTFSDRYFSFAFALAGVFPLYFPMVRFYHTNHRTTTDNHRTKTDG